MPERTSAEFGSRVRLMRESKDWSMADLSHATGTSKTYIVRIETGRPRPANVTLAMVSRLADALGCSSAWLAFGKPDDRA